MIRFTLHDLWSRKRRLVGAGLAVVLGVAFLTATLAITDTMRAGFDRLFTDANAGLDVVVRDATVIGAEETSRRGTLDAAVGDDIAAVPGVRTVVPLTDGIAQIESADGRPIGGDGPPTLGVNWIADPEVNPWQLAEGRAPETRAAGDTVEVVIDRRSARAAGLEVGDLTTVRAPAPISVEVVGIVVFGDLDSMGPATYTGFSTDVAAALFVDGARVSEFRVAAQPGVDAGALRDAIEATLPPGAEALTGAELTAEMVAELESDFLAFVEIFLLMFAVVALLVAAISIANTFAILVAQRTREAALLRAIGATRAQVLGSSLLESMVVGLVASLTGLAAGFGLGSGLRGVMSAAGIDLPGRGVILGPSTIAIALGTGLIVTVLAGLMPAIRSSRVHPVEALRDAAVDRAAAPRLRGAVGLVGLAAGTVVLVTATRNDESALLLAALGAVSMVLAWLVAAPIVTRPAMALIGGALGRVRGTTGRLAGRNSARNPRRTAASASALLVGTTVAALFTTMAASITASIGDIVDRTFGGDLVIAQQSFSGAALPPELAPAVESLPEVAVTAPITVAAVVIDGYEEVVASDPGRLSALLDLDVVVGSFDDMQPGEIAVATDEALQRGWKVGDSLAVTYPGGEERVVRVAVRYNESQIVGDVVMHHDDWRPYDPAGGDVAVLVGLADGVDRATGAAAVDAVNSSFSAPPSQTRQQYIDDVAGEIQTLLGVVYGLLGLAVVIALMGIANALALAIHERRAELGLLRAIGQTRSQLRSTVRWESVLTAIFGAVPGVALGAFLAWGLVRAVDAQEGLGSFSLPVGTLVVLVALAVIAGALAAVRPARRAARLDVIAAMSGE